jgi:glutamate-1-semialdehyde 2,1-aminomutase
VGSDHPRLPTPKHNWFMSTALTEADVDIVLEATDAAFGEVAKRL